LRHGCDDEVDDVKPEPIYVTANVTKCECIHFMWEIYNDQVGQAETSRPHQLLKIDTD
jgi:hypothetical protein